MHWDLFCRVIDNFGDIGVCWRLAADLGARGEHVRLHLDDASALAWMAPMGAPKVQVLAWDAAVEPGDVVVEAFGCDPPPEFVARMAQCNPPPLWINLEYLSAEAYVRRSHGLRSPQLAGPGQGLDKWFFYPGFEPGTGGLLRESGLIKARRDFDGRAWLSTQGLAPRSGERVTSLFCYADAPLAALWPALAEQPTLLLAAPGGAAQALRLAAPCPAGVRCVPLPWFSQSDYDRLLWSCDLNFVRGEDSFVRAMWAGMPFVWQTYAQPDGVHAAKLEAFLALMLADADAPLAADIRALFRAWNGLGAMPQRLPTTTAWRALSEAWCERLCGHADLSTRLLGFASEKR
jgi:uncharacterized repeat protein (TIGR03837 family)